MVMADYGCRIQLGICAVCQRSPSRADARAVLCRSRALHAPSVHSLKPARPTIAGLLRAHLKLAATGAL